MKEDIKAKWLEALRSDRFKQGTGRLARKTEAGVQYCCLGVLCELAVEAGVAKGLKTPFGIDYSDNLGGSQNWFLPHGVARWAGLEGGDPYVGGGALSHHNDEGKSFEEIANLIEEHL